MLACQSRPFTDEGADLVPVNQRPVPDIPWGKEEAHLAEQVCHGAVIHHRALGPFGSAEAVGAGRTAIVVPSREIVPREKRVVLVGIQLYWICCTMKRAVPFSAIGSN